MFKLIENALFSKSILKYEDEYQTSVLVKRDGEKLITRLRFSDPKYHVEPVTITLNSTGEYLRHNNAVREKLDEEGANSVKTSVANYIHLMYHLSEFLNALLSLSCLSGMTEEDSKKTFEEYRKFEEFEKYIDIIEETMAKK